MPLKKNKSDDALAVLGMHRTGRIGGGPTSPRVDKYFHISFSRLHWAMRGAQLVLGIVAFSLYTSQDTAVIQKASLRGANIAFIILTFFLQFLTAFLASMYLMNWAKKWSSRRILLIETISDLVFAFLYSGFFAGMLQRIGVGTEQGSMCPAGESAECDKFNFTVTWTFFYALAWLVSLLTDIASWYRAGDEMYGGSRLDDQSEMDVRRARMGSTSN